MTSTYSADVLRQKLLALTERTNSDSFLIITESNSQKFVQFGGRDLFFDLPQQTLSQAEMSRAGEVLKRFGVTGPITYNLGYDSDGPEQISFQKDLAGDISQAIAMVEAVLFEVYRFDQFCSVSYDEY